MTPAFRGCEFTFSRRPPQLTALLLTLVAALVLAPPAHAGKLTKTFKQLAEGKKFGAVDLALPRSAMQDPSGSRAGLSWIAHGDTVDVVFLTAREERKEMLAESIRLLYANGRPAVAVVTLTRRIDSRDSDEWKDLADLEPIRFVYWTESLGCLYETKFPDLYINLPGPDAVAVSDVQLRLVRVFAPAPWPPHILGETQSIDTIAQQIKEAGDRNDIPALRALVAGRERPRFGSVAALLDNLWHRDPDGNFPRLSAMAEAASDWPSRAAVLNEIRAEYRRMKQFMTSELAVPPQLQHAVDLDSARAKLGRIARRAFPPGDGPIGAVGLIREAAAVRIFGESLDPSLVTEWTDRFSPHIANLDAVAADHTGLQGFDPFADLRIAKLGAVWRNEPPAGGTTLDLEVGALDLSSLEAQSTQKLEQTGGWVTAAGSQIRDQETLEKLRAEQAGAEERIAAIDAELRDIDFTAAGTELKGMPGERVVTREYDEEGKYIGSRSQESTQNIYRVGVAKDIKARAARKKKLKAEKSRLQELLGQKLPEGRIIEDGKIWDPKGGYSWRPGYALRGTGRRTVALTGAGFSRRAEQARDVHAFRATQSELEDPRLRGSIEQEFEAPSFSPMYVMNGNPLGKEVSLLVREAIGEAIDREAANAGPAADEDRAWARALFNLGEPPDVDLLRLAVYGY